MDTSGVKAILKCPVTHKRSFSNEAEAIAFEEKNRTEYNNPRQYPFACEDCDSWHLTSSPPGTGSMARVDYNQVPIVAADKRSKYTEKREEILQLKRRGLSFQEIAEKTGVPYGTVYTYCVDAGLHQAKEKESRAFVPVTIDSLSQKEQALQAELSELQARKQKLIDEKSVKIVPFRDGIIIKKEFNSLPLSLADARQLIEKLTQHLSIESKAEATS